jgi:hypothetical protein
MANLTPIRDDAGNIVGLGPRRPVAGFATLLDDTMTAVGATPAHEEEEEARPPRSFGRLELAGIVYGLILAGALIVLVNRVVPAQEVPPTIIATPTVQPTSVSRPLTVYDQIQTAIPPTEAPPTATPEPPTQTPVVVYVEQPPCYSVTQDVYSADKRAVIGTVTGQSCESQEAAQAAADTRAAEMRGNP